MSEQQEVVEKWLGVEIDFHTEEGDVLSGRVFLRALVESDTFAVEVRKSNLAGVPWAHLSPTNAVLLQCVASVSVAIDAGNCPEWLDPSPAGLLAKPRLVVALYETLQNHSARYLQHLRAARGKPPQVAPVAIRVLGSHPRLPG
jgi:hypothetical protein